MFKKKSILLCVFPFIVTLQGANFPTNSLPLQSVPSQDSRSVSNISIVDDPIINISFKGHTAIDVGNLVAFDGWFKQNIANNETIDRCRVKFALLKLAQNAYVKHKNAVCRGFLEKMDTTDLDGRINTLLACTQAGNRQALTMFMFIELERVQLATGKEWFAKQPITVLFRLLREIAEQYKNNQTIHSGFTLKVNIAKHVLDNKSIDWSIKDQGTTLKEVIKKDDYLRQAFGQYVVSSPKNNNTAAKPIAETEQDIALHRTSQKAGCYCIIL